MLGAVQEVASQYVHIAGCARHRIQLEKQLPMLSFDRVCDTARLQCCIHVCCVRDKPSGGRGALARCSRNQKNLSNLIWILYQRNGCERTACLPAWRGWDIRGRFLGTRVLITNEFCFGLGVELKPKVKLFAE